MPARGRDRRWPSLLGGAAIVGATATMAVAAQTALPGESLYSVKRGIEAAEVRFAGDDAARGRALLANAETRLTELEALTANDDPSAQQTVPDTLDAFTEQSERGRAPPADLVRRSPGRRRTWSGHGSSPPPHWSASVRWRTRSLRAPATSWSRPVGR